MKINYIASSIFILILFLSSCTERLDIELDETYDRLVVEGNLTNDTMAHTFFLSKTSSYFYNQTPPKVEGAIIKLVDNLGNTQELSETEEGAYSTPESYYGISGRNYELQINLEEEIGKSKSFEATSELVAVDPIDSIRMTFNNGIGEEGFWILNLYATDPIGIKNFYMFNVYRNGELLSDSLNKVSFTDDKLFDGNFTNGIGIMYFNNNREDLRFEIGDTVTLQMAGINEIQYTYFNEVIQATSFQNPLFGGPPANVKGNISGGAFGFFGAFSTTYSTVILTEDNIIYEDF